MKPIKNLKSVISLEDMAFHSPIGYYESERVQKNYFNVNVAVTFETNHSDNTEDLSKTVNYENIYNIVKKAMNQTAQLMETPARQIISDILELSSIDLLSIHVKICKLQPPLPGKVGQSCVAFHYENPPFK